MRKYKDSLIQRYYSLKGSSFFTRVLGHSRNYFTATIAVKAIAVVSMPIMTRLLSPSDYGVLNVYGSYVGILSVLLTLNIAAALGRYYYEEKPDFPDFLGTSFLFVNLMLILSFFVFIIWREKISSLLGLPVSAAYFIVPTIFFGVLASWYEQIYIPQKKSGSIAKRNVAQAVLVLIFSILFIVLIKDNKYMGSIYAGFFIGICFMVYYWTVLREYFKWSFNWQHIKYMLHYSVPLIPYSLSSVILAQFDRVMINNSSGPADAGLYSVAYNVAMMITAVTSSLHLAWMPDYMTGMEKKEYTLIAKDSDKILKLVCFCAFVLICFSREALIILASPKFHSSYFIIPIVVIGYVFYSVYAFYGWSMGFAKKNIYISIITLSCGALNIFLNYIYLPKYGYVAAAYTTTVCFAVMVVFGWMVNKYVLKLYSLPVKIVFKQLSIFFGFVALYYLVINIFEGIIIPALLKSVLVLCYLILIYKIHNLKSTHNDTLIPA